MLVKGNDGAVRLGIFKNAAACRDGQCRHAQYKKEQNRKRYPFHAALLFDDETSASAVPQPDPGAVFLDDGHVVGCAGQDFLGAYPPIYGNDGTVSLDEGIAVAADGDLLVAAGPDDDERQLPTI